MKIDKLKFTKLQNEIFSLLCKRAGERLTQLEVANGVKASPPAVSKSLPALFAKGLIKVEREYGRLMVSLDRESRRALEMKMVENLRMIFISDVITFLEALFPGSAIIIFGSYSRGEDIAKSDIDIAIIGSNAKNVVLEPFENALGKEISLHFYRSFKGIEKELKENILSGILLAGRIEL